MNMLARVYDALQGVPLKWIALTVVRPTRFHTEGAFYLSRGTHRQDGHRLLGSAGSSTHARDQRALFLLGESTLPRAMEPHEYANLARWTSSGNASNPLEGQPVSALICLMNACFMPIFVNVSGQLQPMRDMRRADDC
jgi:hypothetical protein